MVSGKKFYTAILGCFVLSLALAGTVSAYPALQLDVGGGIYDPVTQTIVAPDNPFTLYALLNPAAFPGSYDPATILTDTYYISAAISPKMQQGEDIGGSFTFDGTTVNATEDMIYGTPPVENFDSYQPKDGKDIAPHDIFETYFVEFEFTFNLTNTTTAYNTQDHPGGFSGLQSGDFYFAEFEVDIAHLQSDYVVHFDLYNKAVRNGDIDRGVFAPFSHDAESTPIPEPTTLLLLGAGLIGLIGYKKKKSIG